MNNEHPVMAGSKILSMYTKYKHDPHVMELIRSHSFLNKAYHLVIEARQDARLALEGAYRQGGTGLVDYHNEQIVAAERRAFNTNTWEYCE